MLRTVPAAQLYWVCISILFLNVCCLSSCWSQESTVQKQDSAFHYLFSNPALAENYSASIIKKAEQLQLQDKLYKSYYILGVAKGLQTNYDSSFYYLDKALYFSKIFDSKEYRIKSLAALGKIHLRAGNKADALKFYNKALCYAKIIEDSLFISKAEHNVGMTLLSLNQKEKEKEYIEKAVHLPRADTLAELYAKNELNSLLFLEQLRNSALEIQLLRDKNAALQTENELSRRNFTLSIAVIALLLITLIVVLVLIYRERKANLLVLELNDKLEQKSLEISKQIETKNTILAIVGHDLRGPIKTLKNILNQEDGNGYKEYSKEITASLEGIDLLLNNLITWGKENKITLTPEPKSVVLFDLLNEIALLFTSCMELKNITLNCEVPTYLTVYADEQQLKTVIRNVINNALKFSYEGSTIYFYVQEEDGHLTLFIKDQGEGFTYDPTTLDSFFYNGQQGNPSEMVTGLGLYLAHHFTLLNKGSLKINSVLNEGTLVMITLPK
ncbi:MAG: tetratricopeptide repeat-containing sensor histidine kinase [Luteibaculaceae bacterium]